MISPLWDGGYVKMVYYPPSFSFCRKTKSVTYTFFSFAGLLVIKYIFSGFYKKIVAYFLGKISECVNSGKPPEVLISEIIEEKFWKSVLNFPLHPVLRNLYFDRNKILLICGKKEKCRKRGKSLGVTGDQSRSVTPIFSFKIWCLFSPL